MTKSNITAILLFILAVILAIPIAIYSEIKLWMTKNIFRR